MDSRRLGGIQYIRPATVNGMSAIVIKWYVLGQDVVFEYPTDAVRDAELCTLLGGWIGD